MSSLRRAGGRADADREDGRPVHLARPGDQRAARQRGKSVRALPRRSREALTTTSTPGTSCGRSCDLALPHDARVQLLLRLHIAHVLQVCSPHTAELDAGVPARGLNGEAYRGHVFWDELYVFPLLNYRLPEIARALLRYRVPPPRRGPRARPRRAATAARCTRGRAAATARRRRSSCTSIRSPGGGSPTSVTTSATSTRRSSTTSGATTRPPRDTEFMRRPRRRDDARDRPLLVVDRAPTTPSAIGTRSTA